MENRILGSLLELDGENLSNQDASVSPATRECHRRLIKGMLVLPNPYPKKRHVRKFAFASNGDLATAKYSSSDGRMLFPCMASITLSSDSNLAPAISDPNNVTAAGSEQFLEVENVPSSISLSTDAVVVKTKVLGTYCTEKNTNQQQNRGWLTEVEQASKQSRVLMKRLSVFEKALIGAAAGGIAGAFTYACLHPIDTVKTRLQTRGAADVYSSSMDAVFKIFKSKGILGFYRGISAVILGSTLSSAIYFGTCELGKAALSKISRFPPIVIPPLAGAMGNIVSSSILVPKEVITQRMQAGAQGSSLSVLLKTIEREGIKGLYVGYSAAILRNLPTSVISFSTFEYLKAAWLQATGNDSLEPFQSVTSGAIAGAIAAALTTPLDVVKTRLMTQMKHGEAILDPETKAKIVALTYTGFSSTMRQIWLEEGWIGLTRGIGPRLLHSACFSALGFFAFETARLAILKQYLERKEIINETAKAL